MGRSLIARLVVLIRVATLVRLIPRAPLTLLVALALGCTAPPPDDVSYLDTIVADRAEKDRAFREGSDSPVPLEHRHAVLPLNYYPPDLDYRVPAELRVAEEQPVFEVPTSTGQFRPMQRIGVLEFMLEGQPRTLSALVEAENPELDRLFVPFADTTNGGETYEAGRYLDLDRTATGIYDLDFNRAYHPYCYYDESYECPFPPPENRLPAAVHAGERLPIPRP